MSSAANLWSISHSSFKRIMPLKWGIAAAGKISNDFVVALKGLPKESHEVIAVAASNFDRAQKFADIHNIPTAYGGYENLGNNQNIDVVYVGTLNPQHYEVVKMMLEYGKHVLCEKPFVMNEKQAKKLIEIAREKRLFLMEAVWSRFFPVYEELKKNLDSGKIGEVLQVTVEFGFPISQTDRIKLKSLGGGAILDLGIYTLQFQQFVFKELEPINIVSSGHLNEDGVDSCVSAIINYSSNKTALISASTLVKLSCEAIVYGTKGTIRVPEFWCPTTIKINDEEKKFSLLHNTGNFNYHNSAGLAYQAEEVKKCIDGGKIESEIMPLEETLKLATLMDKLRSKLGVVFPADSEM